MAATTRTRNINVSSALDELFPSRQGPQVDEDAVWIERDLIEPNPRQPRKAFSSTTLRDLGASLKADGQLQACVVRSHPDKPGRYQIISGERRWRASGPKFADLPRLRCVIREASDVESFRLALAENLHREDLSVVERAKALVQIKNSEPGFTWEKVAEQAQLSKRRILHLVELLKLPDDVLAHLGSGEINEKHARALLASEKDPQRQREMLSEMLRSGISGNAAMAQLEGRGSRGSARNARGGQTPSTAPESTFEAQSTSSSTSEGVPARGSNSGAKIERLKQGRATKQVEVQMLFEPILHAIENAISRSGELSARQDEQAENGGEPGFTLPLAHDSFLETEAREQIREVKKQIEALEAALLPQGTGESRKELAGD